MSGGSAAGVEPAWLFDDNRFLDKLALGGGSSSNEDAILQTAIADQNPGEEGEGSDNAYGMMRVLKEGIFGNTPYTGEVGFDPDPIEDANILGTRRTRLFPDGYERFDISRTNFVEKILNQQNTAYSGPGDVLDKFSGDRRSIIVAEELIAGAPFDPDNYDISGLVSGIVASAINASELVIDEAATRTVEKVGFLGREAQAMTDAAAMELAASISVAPDLVAEGAAAQIQAALTMNGAVDETGAATDTEDVVAFASGDGDALAETSIEAAIVVLKDAANGLGPVITAALSAATNAANSALVDNAVEAFEDQGLPEHSRRMNRLSGTMVDINAVYGSAFILGSGLLERQYQREVASFRAELSTRLYERAFEAYKEMFNNALGLYMGQLRELIAQRIEAFKVLLTERSRVYLTTFAQHLEIYTRLVASFGDSTRSSLAHQTALVDKLLGLSEDFTKTFGINDVQQAVNARLNRLAVRDQYGLGLLSSLNSIFNVGIAGLSDVDKEMTNLNVKRYIANNEVLDKNLEKDKLDRLWRLDFLGKGINYLGSAAGISTQPEGQSQVQSALGGATAAVGAAALVPGIGQSAVIGAGIAGGIAGLFQ